LKVKEYTIYFDKEWQLGVNNRITLSSINLQPFGSLTFNTPSGAKLSEIYTTSATFFGRIAFQEKFIEDGFRRVSLGTTKPIFSYRYQVSIEDFLGSDYTFHKAQIDVTDRFYFGGVGTMEMQATIGKIWGTLPYPLLYIHIGNDSYYFDEYAFNLMNPFEFISSEYAELKLTHHFNGLFLNKFPLIKKLQWRTLIFGRGAIGRLSEDHEELVGLPENSGSLKEPYVEVGAGVENIFKLIRIDVLWRLTNLDNPGINHFGVNASLTFSF